MRTEDLIIEFAEIRGMKVDINFRTGAVKLGSRTFKTQDAAMDYIRSYDANLAHFGVQPTRAGGRI